MPGRRRRAAVREALPRGLPGRPLVADDPAQARGVPARVRRLRLRARRALRRARRRAAARRRRRSSATAARSRRRSTTPRRAVELVEEAGSLAAYVWRFEPPPRAAPLDRAALGGARADRRLARAGEGPASGAAGASSGRRRSTRSCRRWGWSTTTSTAARRSRPVERARAAVRAALTGGGGSRSRAQAAWASASRAQRSTSTRTSWRLYSTEPFESATGSTSAAARSPAAGEALRRPAPRASSAGERLLGAASRGPACTPTEPTATRAERDRAVAHGRR